MSELNLLNVNMADMKVASPPLQLRTVLGSCIGVFFYEPRMKLGGMVHILLPFAPEDAGSAHNPAKFADTGILALLSMMQKEGAQVRNLICKLCGGAKMFAGFSSNSITDIGTRNQTAALEILSKLGIRVHSKDLGGTTGRKIIADPETGIIKISHFNVGDKVI